MSYRTLYCLPLLIAVAGSMSAIGQPSRAQTPTGKPEDRSLEVLMSQLQRRFHDTEAVDFGFSRVYRPEDRRHIGPVAGKNIKRPEPGATLPPRSVLPRPQMVAENEAETRAIKGLAEAKQDVTIYTFGLLGQDRRVAPAEGVRALFEPGIPRARGPAYLTQKGAEGPDAQSLVLIAEQAWKEGRANTTVAGPEGWTLRIQRVVADNKKCVSCHAGNVNKLGDAVGLVMVGTRPAAR